MFVFIVEFVHNFVFLYLSTLNLIFIAHEKDNNSFSGDYQLLKQTGISTLQLKVPDKYLKSINNIRDYQFHFEQIFDQDTT